MLSGYVFWDNLLILCFTGLTIITLLSALFIAYDYIYVEDGRRLDENYYKVVRFLPRSYMSYQDYIELKLNRIGQILDLFEVENTPITESGKECLAFGHRNVMSNALDSGNLTTNKG